MKLSRVIYNDGIDNDIIDDQSILNATVEQGWIMINGNEYQALVFGAEHTIKLAVLEKALQLAQSGGAVLFYNKLPTASAENGKNDDKVTSVLKELLNTSSLHKMSKNIIEHKFKSGGYTAYIKDTPELLSSKLSQHIERDFIGKGGEVYFSHRSIGEHDVYLIQNTESNAIQLEASFRVDGVPELWDPFSGTIKEVNNFKRKNGYMHTTLSMEGNVAQLLVFKAGDQRSRKGESTTIHWSEKVISKDWKFSVMPTRNNLWGNFTWPPSNEKIGPEVRQFNYKEESDTPGIKLGWNKADFNDENWESLDFDDSAWDYATVKGVAGDQPWGEEYLQNLGGSTTPYRPLSVNLSSPYIQVFDALPDIVYDVKSESASRIGWYRFKAPPGLKEIALHTENATVWVDGIQVPLEGGVAKIMNPPTGISSVAIRLKMKRGEYAGAAFELPLKLKLEGGIIQAGLWDNYALPTYSGIGVYKQKISFTLAETQKEMTLDLGKVYVAAEVMINGTSAGICVASPYKYDLSGLVKSGENEIEIRVANTLAPHYSIPLKAMHLGPMKSGLLGPVQLKVVKD